MSELTPEIIQRGRGADPIEVARRRRANRELQATREKLTSTSGLERAFDYELLRQFAETRRNAAVIMYLLTWIIGGASTVWVSAPFVLMWLALIMLAMSVSVLFTSRYLKLDPATVAVGAWRLRFVVGEFVQGAAWAVLLVALYGSGSPGAQTFLLFLALLITAVTAMLAANVPTAVYSGIAPLSGAILSSIGSLDNVEWLTMAMVAAGGQLYFVILANRLYSPTRGDAGVPGREGRADRRTRAGQGELRRGAPARRGGQPRQVALPGDDEPRAAHAAQRHPRLLRGDEERGARPARRCPPTRNMPTTSIPAASICSTSSTRSSTCRASRRGATS